MPFADGGKFVCFLNAAVNGSASNSRPNSGHTNTRASGDSSQCLVYSIGTRYDTSFERDVIARTGGACEVHTFDPTINTSLLADQARIHGFHVHALGLGASKGGIGRNLTGF